MHRVVVLACLALAGCPAEGGTTDAAMDGGAIDGSAGDVGPLDAGASDVGPHDGGRCTDTPLTGACTYMGYGSPCGVACDFPAGCTFEVNVTWSGHGYCCGSFGEGSWVDCVCESGSARCRPAFTSPDLPRSVPTSYCEFCFDGGPIDDASTDDAAVYDAGP